MNPFGTILLLNGASSSGKTSILHALQDLMQEPYLEAGIDKFIFMLPQRYLERPLWDDVLGLATCAGETGRSLVHGMHRAIHALSQAGCNVLADHVLVEPAWVQDCAGLFRELPAYLVGVRCPLEVLVERERSRKNRTLGQAAAQFGPVHADCTYDLEVDSARYTALENAAIIRDFLGGGAPPQALRRLAHAAAPERQPGDY